MALQLRPISPSDLSEIIKINDEVQPNPWSPGQIRQELAQNNPYSRVAIKDGQVLGYCFVREMGENLEIMAIGVKASLQRQGVGKALLLDLADKKAKNSEIFLEVSQENHGAVHFYQALGFQTQHVRKAYYPDGTDGLCMKLNIAKT